jgi:hypothetical protein
VSPQSFWARLFQKALGGSLGVLWMKASVVAAIPVERPRSALSSDLIDHDTICIHEPVDAAR